MPVVLGERETYRQIVLYTLLLLAASLMLFATRYMGSFYLVSATLLGLGLLVLAVQVGWKKTLKSARTMFWFSNYYLALIFAAMVIDRVIR
ncbi:MAG: heme o synthase, partial [Ktedonobacterales bacterium]